MHCALRSSESITTRQCTERTLVDTLDAFVFRVEQGLHVDLRLVLDIHGFDCVVPFH